MATGLKYRRRRQVILDESGYSDDGLYSDDEYKPPVSYLQRRRNAICVTSVSTDKETPSGTNHVMSFLKQRGIPHMRKSRSEESDSDLSSDDDRIFPRKVSEEQKKKNVSVQMSQLNYKNPTQAEQYFADDKRLAFKAEKVQLPGFLKTQQRAPVEKEVFWGTKRIADTPPAPPPSAKDMSTAIGKTSLLSNRMPNNGIQILSSPNKGVEPL